MYLYIEYKNNIVYAVDMYIMMLVEYIELEYVCSSCLHDTSTVAV